MNTENLITEGMKAKVDKELIDYVGKYRVMPRGLEFGPREYLSFEIEVARSLKAKHVADAYERFGMTNYRNVPITVRGKPGFQVKAHSRLRLALRLLASIFRRKSPAL